MPHNAFLYQQFVMSGKQLETLELILKNQIFVQDV